MSVSAELYIMVAGLIVNLFGMLLSLMALAFFAGKFSESSRLQEKRMDKIEDKMYEVRLRA